ncbi:hypothetical protein M405DRAFT_626447 [Rhizopogon salebrosus TDB-379]|nr:hypothetical protein M405DRAFT_626447 [Rhizopogon salebrosus TDB-379]
MCKYSGTCRPLQTFSNVHGTDTGVKVQSSFTSVEPTLGSTLALEAGPFRWGFYVMGNSPLRYTARQRLSTISTRGYMPSSHPREPLPA